MLAAVVVAFVRWWTSRDRRVFELIPDEPSQLAIARFVAGGERWNLFDHSTRSPGYGIFMAPVYWLTDDPTSAFRLALLANALLGGVACVLMYALARRLTDLNERWCAAAALIVVAAPPVMFTTNWAWAEALVLVVASASLLALLHFYGAPSIGRGTTLIVLAVAGYGIHSRLLPILVVTVGVIAVVAWQRRLAVGAGIGLVAFAVVLFGAMTWLSSTLVDAIWEAPDERNSFSGVLDQLAKLPSMPIAAIGQVWYQLLATAGVVGIGVCALLAAARGRAPSSRRVADARLVLLTTACLFVLSVVFAADRWRPDQVVYGRYNDAIIGPVVLAGIGGLVTANRRQLVGRVVVTLAALAVSGAALQLFRDEELSEGVGVPSMIVGLQAYISDSPGIYATATTALGLVVAGSVMLAVVMSRSLRRPAAVVFGLLLALSVVGYSRTAPRFEAINTMAALEDVGTVAGDPVPPGAAIRFREVRDHPKPDANWSQQYLRRMVYQFYLPDNPVYRDGDPRAGETPYVFAPLDDTELASSGATLAWRDPSAALGLWVVGEPASTG